MSQTPSVIPDAHHAPYQLPLNPHDFKLAIQRGLGRIYQHATQYGLEGMEDAVVHACTHNLRYDTQCEDASQDWLINIIQCANAQDRIFPRILDHIESTLANTSADDEEIPRYYFAGMLLEIANVGISRARELLYKLLITPAAGYDTPPGADEVISLDGKDGLAHVFEQLASLLNRDQLEQWTVGLCLSHYDEQHSEGDGLILLSEWSRVNEELSSLLEFYQTENPSRPTCIESNSEQDFQPGLGDYRSLPQFLDRSTRKKDAIRFRDTTAEDVISWVNKAPGSNYGAWIRRWGRHAPKDETLTITSEILRETNPNHIHKYLMAFTQHCPLPFIDCRLLALVDNPSEKVRWKSYQALATCSQSDIRELAFTKRSRENLTEGSLYLFTSSYQPGDHAVIEEALFLTDDHHDLHTIGFSLLDIFKERNTPESLNSMLYLYEHGPCMNCRYHAIEIMQKAEVIPDWVSQEARHDADGSIRELITGSEDI